MRGAAWKPQTLPRTTPERLATQPNLVGGGGHALWKVAVVTSFRGERMAETIVAAVRPTPAE